MLTALRSLSLPQSYVPTVFENYTASFEIDTQRIELSLWDTSGERLERPGPGSRSGAVRCGAEHASVGREGTGRPPRAGGEEPGGAGPAPRPRAVPGSPVIRPGSPAGLGSVVLSEAQIPGGSVFYPSR